MGYFYAAVWFAAGLLLIFRMGRENRVFYPLGGYFLFLGAWWTVRSAAGINLFTGVWGWIFRVVTVAALGLALWAFWRERRKKD